MTARLCSLGNLSIDDLVFVDGTTQWAVPGGNAVYAALGMAVWGERPAVIAPFGPDYPTERLHARVDLEHAPRIDRTLRDWGLYEEDGSRQFIFRRSTQDWDAFSPRAKDVLAGTISAHLAPLPWDRHVELVAALRQIGTTTISIDLDDRRLAEVTRAAVAALMASVDLFLPSRQDGTVIFPDASPADTVRRFRDLSPDTPLIALKCGADGCVAHAAGSRDLLIDTRRAGRGSGRHRGGRHVLRRSSRRLHPDARPPRRHPSRRGRRILLPRDRRRDGSLEQHFGRRAQPVGRASHHGRNPAVLTAKAAGGRPKERTRGAERKSRDAEGDRATTSLRP